MDEEIRQIGNIRIKGFEDGTRFEFRLLPTGSDIGPVVAFGLDQASLMGLLETLQRVQKRYNIQIPPTLPPLRGGPNLRIVTDDET